MSEYYWIIIWIAVFAILSNMVRAEQSETVCGEKVYRYTWWWAILAIIPLLYLCSVRQYIGDTAAYTRAFNEMPESISGFFPYMDGVKKDRGFYAFSALIKTIIGNEVELYFLIIAALQGILLVKIYRKYSTRYVLSIFLFLISTDYISWMFNGIRQFLAVTITFAACPFILKKKYAPAILMVLLASTVHGTALLVLPFMFIVQGGAWNKKTILFIFATIAIVFSIGQFTTILDTMLQETQYQNVVSDWKEWQDDGTNFLRVLVYSIPAILSLIGLKYIKKADNPIINMSTNMSIIATGFYVVSMFTSGVFIGRLPIYFSLYPHGQEETQKNIVQIYPLVFG
ncbi:MAG: EpsG family protein [Lachnospiraceae bacterium]|nr:EpsG family protein [Lachnospiraceae bacterium]